MKNLILFFALFISFSTLVVAQVPPQAFNYSAVARNPAGQPIASTTIGIQISILKTSTTGAVQYSENHFVNTDAFGLFNLVIGAGAVQSGSMASIDWSNDNYYLKVGMDATGGTNFLTMGTTQLLSVPYAMHAKTAENGIDRVSNNGDTLYLSNGQIFIAGNNNNGGGSVIGTPIFTQGSGVTDIDGNQYPTIILGSQEWMASNLKTTRFANGDLVPNVTDSAQWASIFNNSTYQPAWCYYNNNSAYNADYGKLYNWYAATDSRNLCPSGWHLPNYNEMLQLVNFIDPNSLFSFGSGGVASVYAGRAMKTIGNRSNQQSLWFYPNTEANNISGFSAIPGGARSQLGEFNGLGSQCYLFYSVNSYNYDYAEIDGFFGTIRIWQNNGNLPAESAFSIRCLKN